MMSWNTLHNLISENMYPIMTFQGSTQQTSRRRSQSTERRANLIPPNRTEHGLRNVISKETVTQPRDGLSNSCELLNGDDFAERLSESKTIVI